MYNIYKYAYCDRVPCRCRVSADSLVRKPAKIAHCKCAFAIMLKTACIVFSDLSGSHKNNLSYYV